MSANYFLVATASLVLAIGVTVCLIRNRKETYVSEVTINRGLNETWHWVSDPTKYNQLYPHWIKRVAPRGPDLFRVDDQFGQSYDMRVITNRDNGIVDLIISLPSGQETSRSRICALDDKTTAIIHLAHRWAGANALTWFFHKITTDRDFQNAKRIIENNGA